MSTYVGINRANVFEAPLIYTYTIIIRYIKIKQYLLIHSICFNIILDWSYKNSNVHEYLSIKL